MITVRFDEDICEWIATTPFDLGEFFGATPKAARAAAEEALRVYFDALRKGGQRC